MNESRKSVISLANRESEETKLSDGSSLDSRSVHDAPYSVKRISQSESLESGVLKEDALNPITWDGPDDPVSF